MTSSRHYANPSREGNSRPGSVARSIIQRRDKPYRTEKAAVLASKRKLDFQTSYTKAPAGFSYVPFGTPELSDRCKELSRNQGQPVYIVNAKPVNKSAIDPDKLSHHVHRIGYHFNAQIVAEACLELGYIVHKAVFVKEADLAEQKNRSRMAQIMASHGYEFKSTHDKERENTDQLRSAMKELFPKIPEQDMEAIIKHAWEDGSLRVGTNSSLGLPRRIQLATIARIRHTYTDYDVLLKAFGDWHTTRQQVEPECLAKLKEWRGENAEDDAEEREWITREYIIIDDDDAVHDTANKGHEADDEDSAAEQGYASETSIEITHHQARDEDLGAESSNETARRYIERLHPRQHNRQVARPQNLPINHFGAHTRPLANGAPSPYGASRPQYYPYPPAQAPIPPAPQAPLPPPQTAALQYETHAKMAVGDRYDRPILLSTPPPPAQYEYFQPPPAPIYHTGTNTAPSPTYLKSNGPDEMVFNGQIFRRVPAGPEPVIQQMPMYMQDHHRQQQQTEPAHNPYPDIMPSIEGYVSVPPQGREDWRAARDPRFAAPLYAPPSPQQRIEYVDLTSPNKKRELALLPQPVHGAPAPVQQIPRGAYYKR